MKYNIDTIVFDLGGVLVDWNPEYVYREVFEGDQEKVDWFLNNICTSHWNVEQDAGRSLSDATEFLVNKHPEYETWIRIYYDRWEDMLAGVIRETEEILNQLKKSNKYRLIALTNWSAETFPIALNRFSFLKQFEGIIVSGTEKTRKPFPKIYKTLIERYHLTPENCVFIDDNLENIIAAEKLNIKGIQFKSAEQLKKELINYNIDLK